MNSTKKLTGILTALCLLFSSCSKEPEPPTEGLFLHYTFDGNIDDLSGNGNEGIDFTAGNFVKGVRGQALDFDGITDYVRLSKSIYTAEGLTFSFWIKPRGSINTENNGVIISKYNMRNDSRCFLIWSFGAYETRNDNRLSAAFYKDRYTSAIHDHVKSYMTTDELPAFPSDPSLWTIANPKKLTIGAWTHCVVNVTGNSIEAWIDGVLCAKKQREYETYFDTPDEPVFIGNCFAIGEGMNNHFNGIIDELRIYNRGLTKEEIQILFEYR
jgi:hypothetical protein